MKTPVTARNCKPLFDNLLESCVTAAQRNSARELEPLAIGFLNSLRTEVWDAGGLPLIK